MTNELSPWQRARLTELLTTELRRACDAAIAGGTPPDALIRKLDSIQAALQAESPLDLPAFVDKVLRPESRGGDGSAGVSTAPPPAAPTPADPLPGSH